MISPYEMALIYWRFLKAHSIFEVEEFIKHLSPTSDATDYWKKVWECLQFRKTNKGIKH